MRRSGVRSSCRPPTSRPFPTTPLLVLAAFPSRKTRCGRPAVPTITAPDDERSPRRRLSPIHKSVSLDLSALYHGQWPWPPTCLVEGHRRSSFDTAGWSGRHQRKANRLPHQPVVTPAPLSPDPARTRGLVGRFRSHENVRGLCRASPVSHSAARTRWPLPSRRNFGASARRSNS